MKNLVEAAHRSAGSASAGDGTAPALSWHAGRFFRQGVPHTIRSGSLHYFRIVPEQWHDRLLRLVDLGLNTVDTYVPWNFHQPLESQNPSFTGWRDVGRFIETAGDLGLDVIVRPGPYICAEWSNGGLPAWLTGRGVTPRSSDHRFTAPVADWFGELLPRLAPLQSAHGGPVVAVQVENEYGSYGDDAAYLEWLADLLRTEGITELLYTADGPTDIMLDGGSLPGILTTATLGSKPSAARALLRERRPDEPFFVAEFWNGWFDHWGHAHHVRDAQNAAETVRDVLAEDGSISLYMAHGGTNFGLWAGANTVDGELRPTITSYDSDAPVAEDGTLTEKFFALRAEFGVAETPLRSADVRFLPARRIPVEHRAPLLPALTALGGRVTPPTASPPSFEDLGLDGGLVAYDATVLLPARDVELVFDGIADRALVFLDGDYVSTVTGSGSVTVTGQGTHARLSVVVENLGRVNYGPRLGERKGLLGTVRVERRLVQRWSARPIALDTIEPAVMGAALASPARHGDAEHAGLSTASFDLDDVLDTHLALPGFTKGFVWVNGTLLGRYWEIGPQRTLYVPGPLLRSGENTIVILELHRSGTEIEFVSAAELGPTEQYIEEF